MKVYKVKEIAEILNLQPKTICGYIKSGKLEAVKPGKEYLITPEALAKFVEGAKK